MYEQILNVLKPNDVIIVHIAKGMSLREIDNMSVALHAVFPSNNVLILPNSTDINSFSIDVAFKYIKELKEKLTQAKN